MGEVVTATGATDSIRRTGGLSASKSAEVSNGRSRTGAQAEASKPGSLHPACSRRASYSSPSYRPAAVTGPALQRQSPPVVTVWAVPSVYSIRSSASRPVSSP